MAADIETARGRLALRRAVRPRIAYPSELPVSDRVEDIAAALADHQVVVVAGETGSGKTTQLPKICLDLGRGRRGMIGHTQPRRIAARAVAERLAEELDVPLGDAVGWKVRFTDHVSPQTLVKVMTDGILLAEIRTDPDLLAYDTLIIDEAHERSLTIDFLLGYLTRLLPRRPDLRVVITSATIDPGRFAAHFGGAPVIEVSGRTYPVEMRYRPLVAEDTDDEPADQITAIAAAIDELAAEPPGDVLVFLSGEREIRDTADALRGRAGSDTEVLPLYGRLSVAEQHRVFTSHAGRRIVLATNVAETSLTVPGIRYVVDPGSARISRYSNRLKVQRLPIEAISQASARQRAGRCGRVADGICIRLYTQDDHDARPVFTDPEILRTNLASVILAMTAWGLGDVMEFPFLDPPDRRQVRDGVQLLVELGAVERPTGDEPLQLTDIGRSLATLPVDPRLGRMVLAGGANGCLDEVLVIASALSIQDPRERPLEHQQAANQLHARFADDTSDFIGYLNLWRYLADSQEALSGNQFRRLCRREFLNYLRVREWQDLYAQLRQACRGLQLRPGAPSTDGDLIHRSLLAGLLTHIGMRDAAVRDYQGVRGSRFTVSPGSSLARKQPRWLMAAELVETNRLWARVVARVEPEWVEQLAEHLVTRSYSEPHWEKKRAAVMGFERVTLYGLPLIIGRRVGYGSIDPGLSRELFIRHGLVDGDWDAHHEFLRHNAELVESIQALEDRLRRRDLIVDDESLVEFYTERIPETVVSGRHFDGWWKIERRTRPELLDFTRDLILNASRAGSGVDYPDVWTWEGPDLPLTYVFDPGADDDGVTVTVPLALVAQLHEARLDWTIPGLREERAVALVRGLPKAVRKYLVPVPDRVRAALQRMSPDRSMVDALGESLEELTGVHIDPGDWRPGEVPAHLSMRIRVVDGEREVAVSRDLDAVQAGLRRQVRRTVAAAAVGLEATGATRWSFGTLPPIFERERAGVVLRGFPALVDEGPTVGVRILTSSAAQQLSMGLGTRRLILLQSPDPMPTVLLRLDTRTRLILAASPYRDTAALLDDCAAAAVDALVAEHGGPAWDERAFAELLSDVRMKLADRTHEVTVAVTHILQAAGTARSRLQALTSPALLPSLLDARSHLDLLTAPGFVSATGADRLTDVARYLRGLDRRLATLPERPQRDAAALATVQALTAEFATVRDRLPLERREDRDVEAVAWLLEELRVSLFAQTVGTPIPVSEKRVRKAMADLLPR